MTTVLAVVDEGWLFMAGDTFTRMYDRACVDGSTKIHRLCFTDSGQQVLMGAAGYGSAGLAFASLPDLLGQTPPHGVDLRQWAGTVSRRVFKFLATDLFTPDDDVSSCAFILGYRERLFTIVHNGAIAHPGGVAALGSGEAAAIGAYIALTRADWGSSVRARVEESMRIACSIDGHSGLPFDLILQPPHSPLASG